MSWPRFNIRDLLIATAPVGIGVAWPIFLILIVPIIVAGILARMQFRQPLALTFYFCTLAYPIVWLSTVYVIWAIAWQVVGHHPSPGNDDPKHIFSPFVTSVYGITAFMFFLLPLAFILGFACLPLLETNSSSLQRARSAKIIVFFAVWIAFGMWWVGDPGQTIEWFFD